ncbi:MAG: hypothetical protein LBV74_05600 [Tannerella sp.]|jgi:hypothetical protein|nr:hypothetical protein [Tannerella sp.]
MMELIEELGLLGYLQKYPVNPITIVGCMIIIGIVVLIINAKIKKKNAEKQKPAGAATVILQKRNVQNNTYAENVRVHSINGKPAPWFFYKLAAAVYFLPGQNTVEIYAEWARREAGKVKMYRTEPVRLTMTVSADKIYALHYHIDSQEYLLTEGDRFEDNTFDKNLKQYVWLTQK